MSDISLVISDVDGTLVTPDKRLTEATIKSVHAMHAAGIAFTIVSSRPPVGLGMLTEPLSLSLPMGVFSGGGVVTPDLSVVEQHFVPQAAVRASLQMLAECGDVWLFTMKEWLALDRDGPYVGREIQTLLIEPSVVADFGPYLDRVCKVVGSSRDFEGLARCESVLRASLGARASVVRSQPYYLDVTPPGVNKGTFVEALANRSNLGASAIAVLGDMENDLPMFRKAGLSIAMGNASPGVQREANYVTASNAEDGFAKAIAQYILDQ
jgi:Cof subfamily protein (haloacid dehalogenase superfamily)